MDACLLLKSLLWGVVNYLSVPALAASIILADA